MAAKLSAADATCDSEIENDLPRPGAAAAAAIGDAITLQTGGDRIKVTLLAFIDPATIDNPNIDRLLRSVGNDDDLDASPEATRYVAVKLKMRNLGPTEGASRGEGLVHTCTGGRIIDGAGREHGPSFASVVGCSRAGVPNRGKPSAIGCYAFGLPNHAVASSYRLAIDDTAGEPRQWMEWRLSATATAGARPAAGPSPLERLAGGAEAWKAWRRANPLLDINLAGADLRGRDLRGFDLARVNLRHARLAGADLSDAILAGAEAESALFVECRLGGTNLRNAKLRRASFFKAYAPKADFFKAELANAILERVNAPHAIFRQAVMPEVNALQANLFEADLFDCRAATANFNEAFLERTNFAEAKLGGATLRSAYLRDAQLDGADLSGADLSQATLLWASLVRADLAGANLSHAMLTRANLTEADICGARVFGASAWNLRGRPRDQRGLTITGDDEATVTVDDLELAQFIHLLLTREKVRNVIETLTARTVLILGRFTPERKAILEAMAAELRRYNLLPIIFDFEALRSRDLTETVKILVGLSCFVIVDVTQPKSAPQELQATIPDYQVAFIPIMQAGEKPYAMLADFKKYDWLLQPVLEYETEERLLRAFKPAIIDRAWQKHQELVARRSQKLATVSIDTFLAGDVSGAAKPPTP